MVEALEPPTAFLIVINLMLDSSPLPLSFPFLKKRRLIDDRRVGLDPESEMPAGDPVHRFKAGQFAEVFREPWDFR